MNKHTRLFTLCTLSPLTACVGVAPIGTSSHPAPIRNPMAEMLGERPLRPVAVANPVQPITVTHPASVYAAQAPYRIQPLPAPQPFVTPASTQVTMPKPVSVNTPAKVAYRDSVYLEQEKRIHILTAQNIQLRQKVDYLNQRVEDLERQQRTIAVVPRKQPSRKKTPPRTVHKPVARIPEENVTPDMSAYRNMPDLTEENLKLARQQFRRGDYRAVLATLRGADSGGNGSTAARHSMYLLLQTNLRLNYCQSVIQIGQRLASRYANSPEAPEALYTVGECQRGIQQQDIARDTWRKLIASYPNSSAARRARVALLKI